MTKLSLPQKKLLQTTSEIDYYHWNYRFLIKYIQRFRFKAILRLLNLHIYDKLLEVGTGSGIFLPELARHCRELYACDLHNRMDAVQRLCELTSTKVNLRRCHIENTKYPSGFFDVIVAVSVLEFVDDLEKAFQEIKRILKTQGIFLTICPQQNLILDSVLRLISRKGPDEEFKQSRSNIYLMLEEHFNVLEKRIFPFGVGKAFPVYYYYKLSI
jgi:ubiquinone/menaquinone biosynthesis C-methylase UbiE